MTRFTIFAAAAALTFTTACGNTAEGVRQDTENAVEETSEAAANAAAQTDAAMETADVKTALMADTRVDAGDINVETNEQTRTVSLNGTVPTEAMKTLAGEVAMSKATGYTVVNNLTVRPQ